MNASGAVTGFVIIHNGAGGLPGGPGEPSLLDSSDGFGEALTGPGDIDGDGISDLIVGAPGDDDGAGQAGAFYVLFSAQSN